MSPFSLNRLRRMTRHEASWRVRAAARTAAQRVAVGVHPPQWNRADIARVLADDVIDESLRTAIANAEWQAVHDQLARRIRGRASRFALDPRRAGELRAALLARWPAAAFQASERADSILAGRYDLLGYRGLTCAVADDVDWHMDPVHNRRAPRTFWADVPYLDPAVGDHKIIWELNRHQHWLQLGRALWLTQDSRYGRGILKALDGWLSGNPPLVGINWASMLEIGFRAMSWTWALHFLLADVGHEDGFATKDTKTTSSPWLVDMFVALDRQLTHLEQNLSVYFSPNTHLTGEALALYVVGMALPELASSGRWVETGRRILLAEIDRQVHADGGHAERSTHYQRYTLDFYLMALLTAAHDANPDAACGFMGAANRLAEFTRGVADDHGRLPLIGDDDGGMLWPFAGGECHDVRGSLALAAVLLGRPELAPWGLQEEAIWVAGRTAIEREPLFDVPETGGACLSSRTFADTGYFVARDSLGGHAVFNVGVHGYMNGAHAHADALAVTLSLANRPLLIDPGTSTYTMDRTLRDRLRSSMSHNTVTLGRRSQAIPSGPFRWQTRADARLHASRHNPAFDWAEASHNGYAPARHVRTLLRTTDSGWLVVDEIVGEGTIAASAHWHFDPGWTLTCDAPGRLRATHLEGDEAWLLHDAGDVWLVRGDEETGLGWYAPVYGTLVPTWTARTTRQAAAPFTIVTWIGAFGVGGHDRPSLDRVVPACDAGVGAVGVRILAGRRASVFLVRPGEPAHRDTASAGRGCGILDYQTNARVLHYVEDAGTLIALDLIDASHALALRDGWISIAADDPIADLHASVKDGVLDLYASEPPPQLRIQGSAVRGLRSVRLNHRDLPPPTAVQADTLVISGVDWAAAPSPAHARANAIPVALTT